MKKAILLIALLLAFEAHGQEFKKVATSGYIFLELPVTARAAALGEAMTAMADVASDAVFTNPAALGHMSKDHSAGFSYAPWFVEMKHYAASYAYNSPWGVIGVGVIVFDYGSMTRVVSTTDTRFYQVLGEFKANATAAGLTYSRKLTDQFAFGVTLKYVNETIDTYGSSNILFDGGVLYYTGVGSWRIAGSLQNFGPEQSYIAEPFKMPAVLRLGTAAELVGDFDSEWRITGSVDAIHPTDNKERVNAGLEVGWNKLVVLRGGYKFFYDEESYSLGVGLLPQASVPAGVDFAFSDYGRLGKVVRFSLHLEF